MTEATCAPGRAASDRVTPGALNDPPDFALKNGSKPEFPAQSLMSGALDRGAPAIDRRKATIAKPKRNITSAESNWSISVRHELCEEF